MKDNRWDIPASQQYNFKNDLAFGKKGEQITKDFLTAIATGSFEVKTDRYRNGRMVVETEQNPRNSGWKPSGLQVTLAEWWVYVYALDGSIVVIKVDRLKRYIATLPEKRTKTFAPMSNNPAKGFLLLPEEVIDLMTNPIYDKASGE
jgi:hypothetical protein